MTKKLHPIEIIERSIKRLNGLPEKPKTALTTRETVEMMRDTIAALRKRGYSFEEIEKVLSEEGLSIKKTELVSGLRPQKKRSVVRASKKPQAPESAAEKSNDTE